MKGGPVEWIGYFLHQERVNSVTVWYDSLREPSGNFSKLLQEQIENANPPRNLTTEEAKRLEKLEAISYVLFKDRCTRRNM